MSLNTPFNYAQYLVGEEILFRALTQQKYLAGQHWYGMTWASADQGDLDSYTQKSQTARRDFTNIPQHCVPYPPCPWDKEVDKVTYGQFKDIIMLADSSQSYQIRVQLRSDSGTNSFTLGSEVLGYDKDQSALDPSIRDQFTFLKKEVNSATVGKAAVVIERYVGGALDKKFYYLFDLE